MQNLRHYFFSILICVALSQAFAKCQAAELLSVYDGDTLIFLENKSYVPYHLYGVDAPEIGQFLYEEAKDFLLKTLSENKHRVVEKSVVGSLYKYTEIFIINDKTKIETDLSCYIIMNGYAYFDKNLNIPKQNSLQYIGAEKMASNKRIGLWTQEKHEYPWNFRSRNKIVEEEQEYVEFILGPALSRAGSISIGDGECSLGRSGIAQYVCEIRKYKDEVREQKAKYGDVSTSEKRDTYEYADNKKCGSDFACKTGYKCVKRPMHSTGICLKAVDESGVQKYDAPRNDSFGTNTEKGCITNVDCPIGFKCDKQLKACVR